MGVKHVVADIVTGEMSYRSLRFAFASLYKKKVTDPLALNRLVAVLKRLEDVGRQRDTIIHLRWGTAEIENVIIRTKTTAKQSRGRNVTVQVVNTSDIEVVAIEIDRVTHKLLSMLDDRLKRGPIQNT